MRQKAECLRGPISCEGQTLTNLNSVGAWSSEDSPAAVAELSPLFDGDFVVWAGVKLPLAAHREQLIDRKKAPSQSQLQHALLQLARGASWDAQSYSTQSTVAALNLASASMIRKSDLVAAAGLLNRADALIRQAVAARQPASRGQTAAGGPGEHDEAAMHRLQSVTLNNTACLMRRQGKLDEAMLCLEEALDIDAALAARACTARTHALGDVGGARIEPNASALLLNLSTMLAVLGRWEEARARAQAALACVWSFETHWQSAHERMFICVASLHNVALAERALGHHHLAAESLCLSLSASVHFFGGEGSLSARVRASVSRCGDEVPVLDYPQWFSACVNLHHHPPPLHYSPPHTPAQHEWPSDDDEIDGCLHMHEDDVEDLGGMTAGTVEEGLEDGLQVQVQAAHHANTGKSVCADEREAPKMEEGVVDVPDSAWGRDAGRDAMPNAKPQQPNSLKDHHPLPRAIPITPPRALGKTSGGVEFAHQKTVVPPCLAVQRGQEGGSTRGKRPMRRWIVDATQSTRWDCMASLLPNMSTGVLDPSIGYDEAANHDTAHHTPHPTVHAANDLAPGVLHHTHHLQDEGGARQGGMQQGMQQGMYLPSTPTGARMSVANGYVSRARTSQFVGEALAGHSRDARRLFLRAQGFVTPKTKVLLSVALPRLVMLSRCARCACVNTHSLFDNTCREITCTACEWCDARNS